MFVLLALVPTATAFAVDATADDRHAEAEADLLATGTWFQRQEAAEDLQAQGRRAGAAGDRLRQLVLSSVAGNDFRLAHLALETLAVVAPDQLPACCPPLATLLQSSDAQAQAQALELVPLLGPAGAALAPRLADLVPTPLGPRALVALGSIGPEAPGVVPTLEAALQDPDPSLVHAAIAAFGTIGPKAEATLPALLRLVGVQAYRRAVLSTLARFGSSAASAVPAVVAAEAAAQGQDRGAFVRTLKCIEAEDIAPTIAPAAAQGGEGSDCTLTPPVVDPDDLPDQLHLQVGKGLPPQVSVRPAGLSLQVHAAYGWSGTCTFPVTVSDGRRRSDPATMTVTIAPDTAPAQLLSAGRTPDGGHVLLLFNKPLDAHAAAAVSHYALGTGVQILQAAVSQDQQTVDLQVQGLPPDGTADLAIQDLPDAAQHPVPTTLPPSHRLLPVQLPGLAVQFFDDKNLTHPTTAGEVPVVDFPQGPKPHAEHYAARYSGWLTAPVTGDYTLALSSDDGGRLFLEERKLVDMWFVHGCDTRRAHVALVAGQRYALRIEYFQESGDECLRFAWKLPGQTAERVVPASCLSHGVGAVP